jgi:hypothetical protein
MSSYLGKGQLETLVPFQATVVEVFPDGRVKVIVGGDDDPKIIPPPYYGGVRDSGTFMHPDIGDTLLCVRVHPGSKGVIQAVAVLAAEGKEKRYTENDETVPVGVSPYPRINQGDVKILSNGGSELFLKGEPGDSEINLVTSERSGIFVSSGLTSAITQVSNMSQTITSGSRLISGSVIRDSSGGQVDVSVGHDIECYSKISGDIRGAYDGAEAQDLSFLGSPRNPCISEYRLVINEFSEESAFTGWDEEAASAMSSDKKAFQASTHRAAIDPRTALSLAPHQLVEVIAGNVINSRGETLDINYGTVEIGDSDGIQIIKDINYESDRLISRRGIGYHFQLSTNSKSAETSDDINNFVYAIDKQGLMKISIPKGSGVGNVLFPTAARFGHASGGVFTEPAAHSIEETIPVTLRNKKGDVILPQIPPGQEMSAASTRNTGIRFTNNSGYFQNFINLSDGGGSKQVRVNFTTHHNMYAAAEMLIANTIHKVLVPAKGTECPGVVLGTSVGEPFERYLGNLDEKGNLKDNELKHMSTVAVLPGAPAIYPGGGTIVAGASSLSQKGGRNQPYTNSFTITGTAGEFSATNSDQGGTGQKSPGGKSANINFEGAVDVSVGRDDYDQKSLVLDTAGSVIAWFGRDKNGRSLVVQTDGAVAVNVGGRGLSDGIPSWKEGRLDIRVNVTDKGTVSKQESHITDGGDHASDYIISISKNGLVIAGMCPGNSMIIRNDGPLSLESTSKLSLVAQAVEVKEGNKGPRKTHKAPTADDQPPLQPEGVADKIVCITDVLSKMTEE